MEDKPTTNEPSIKQERVFGAEPRVRKYLVDVYIPPECLEGESCPHDKKPVKRDLNPI